jgi:hypothetical protein
MMSRCYTNHFVEVMISSFKKGQAHPSEAYQYYSFHTNPHWGIPLIINGILPSE